MCFITHGKLIYTNIPRVLEANGEKFKLIIRGYNVELSLTYHCGDQKMFSIYMNQTYKKWEQNTKINTFMFNAVDVNETHEVQPGIYRCDYIGTSANCSSKAGYVTWSITP